MHVGTGNCCNCNRLATNIDNERREHTDYRGTAESRIKYQDSLIAGLRQELLESESDCSALIGQLGARDQEIERLKKNLDLCMTRPQGFTTTHCGEP